MTIENMNNQIASIVSDKESNAARATLSLMALRCGFPCTCVIVGKGSRIDASKTRFIPTTNTKEIMQYARSI